MSAPLSITHPYFGLYVVSTADAQQIARQTLGRNLTANELAIIQNKMNLDWQDEIEMLIDVRICPKASQCGNE